MLCSLPHLSQGDKVDENEDEDAPAVRLIATLSLVNVALPRLIVAGRQVNMPAAWLKLSTPSVALLLVPPVSGGQSRDNEDLSPWESHINQQSPIAINRCPAAFNPAVKRRLTCCLATINQRQGRD